MKSTEARAAHWAIWKSRFVWLSSAACVLAVMLMIRSGEGDRPAAAQGPGDAARSASPAASGKTAGAAALPRPGRPKHDVMAVVNGQSISRAALTEACVRRHGESVLESLVNKRLIMNHCQKRNITVTNEEIAAEVDRMAKRFKLGREQWLDLLEKERGVTAQEYARDIVWPTLALRKLAAEGLEATEEEISLAFEREFGEMIQARLIAVNDEQLARQLHAQLTQDSERFARLAIEHSQDVNSASVGGLIQPIRRHVGDKVIEQEAYRLQKGDISPVMRVGDQYVILKCEGRIPARAVNMADARPRIVERIKDEKLREVAHTLFAQLQAASTIQNVYNDPKLRDAMPGVVAAVNGDQITMKQLGSECLLRHGEEVLEVEIGQLLLEQSLKQSGLQVETSDLDAEMRHAAELAGVIDEQGDADLATWIETITTEQGVTRSQYMRDAVWPSAALKKLTAQDVQVTEEDIRKSFEANFGERVRCRAIVLGDMRRAQEVWDKARRNPSEQYFGDLAAEYSIEPTSKSLRGEVPPIQRFGGQPQLEEVAFNLQPGQLSGIVQVGDKLIILRCEGRTERIDMNEGLVRADLQRDIYEKKLRIAMSKKFEEIREKSRIDNYLASTTSGPAKQRSSGQAGAGRDVRRDAAVRPTSGSTR